MSINYNLILSISSDIGYEIANQLLNKKKKIIGTYLNETNKTKLLRSKGILLYKVNFKNKKNIDIFCKRLKHKKINLIISCVGTLEPVGKFTKVNFNKWSESVMINSINQIRCILNIIKKHDKLIKIILFAGGGTNNATKNYSAYTLSKIMLIKFTELINFEEKNISCTIIGPGWVNTKIHKATFENKNLSGKNYFNTKKMLNSNNVTPLHKVVQCVSWILNQKKNIVGGKNISLVHDNWGNKKFKNLLKNNPDIYTLRRKGNNK